jgi:hypothetical protein
MISHNWKAKIEVRLISVSAIAFFGPHSDVADYEGFDVLSKDLMLQRRGRRVELEKRRSRVNYDMHATPRQGPTHVTRRELVEGSLAVIEVSLGLTLQEGGS